MTNDVPFENLVQVLERRSRLQRDRVAYRFLNDGSESESVLTYGELGARARAVAGTLLELEDQNRRALLMFPPGLDYIVGYMGCLIAGWAPVPAYPPDPSRLAMTFPRLKGILEESKPRAILTTQTIRGMADALLAPLKLAPTPTVLAVDGLSCGEEGAPCVEIQPETIALIQYTSGSISRPKGVLVTHRNLMHNVALVSEASQADEESAGVCWCPPYHDMGLIGGILSSLFAGYLMTLMSPIHFLMKPRRWLDAMSRYRVDISVAPNFAYGLVVRKTANEDATQWDLSNLRTLFNGAEPIRAEIIEAFSEKFATSGFKKSAFMPCYGLAEATLMVTGSQPEEVPATCRVSRAQLTQGMAQDADDDGDAFVLTGSGRALLGGKIAIVEPQTHARLVDGAVGEVWIQSESVAAGYLDQPELSEKTFQAYIDGETPGGPYLRSGDLGFSVDEQLYVVGRLKDVIIIRGRNYYPADIEATVEASHPNIRPGCTVATSSDEQGEEALILLVEADRRSGKDRRHQSKRPARERRGSDRRSEAPLGDSMPAAPVSFDPKAIAARIREEVFSRHGVRASKVVLVQPRSLPKTPSGKIRRREARQLFLDGKLEILATSEGAPRRPKSGSPDIDEGHR